MKKKFLILCCFSILMVTNVSALSNDRYYLPTHNTYYTRSQHTYSYVYEGETHNSYVPANYTLIRDLDETLDENSWDFLSKYTVPWQPLDTSYNVAYCVDVLVSIQPGTPYRKVSLADSSYLPDSIKQNLAGILTNTVPFISMEEMQKMLLDSNVLEYKEVNGEKVLTAKGNPYASRNISLDEFVSATQMAIYNYTNPGIVNQIYYRTTVLSTKTVLRQAGLWDNLYKTKGFYDEVGYNIQAVYDYLIQLKAPLREETLVHSIRIIDGVLHIALNRTVDERSNLKIKILYKDFLVKEFQVDNSSDYTYELGDKNLEDFVIETVGEEFVLKDIYVFEGVDGKKATQTLSGISSNRIEVANKTNFQNLNIQKIVSKDTVAVGEQFDYIIKVINPNGLELDGIFVEDDIPDDLKIINTDGDVLENHVSFKLHLNPKEEKELKIHVELKNYMDNNQIKNTANLIFGNKKIESNEVVVNLTGNKDFIENPQTGTSFPFFEMIGIFCGIVIVFYFTKKKAKLFHMK